jgi:succinylglutamate desuccinylase
MLRQYSDLPPGFLTASAHEIEEVLGGPSLIHLPGLRERPLFVSVLLHGNEITGLEAIQALLRVYLDRPLPRALSLFVGNVSAARHAQRRLDGQPDYNRVWPGGEDIASEEARMLATVVDQMRQRRVFASIDVHNNTGLNPHYACVNRLDGRFLYLASLFSHTVVYFTRPRGVQAMAMAELCPAITVECGQPGSEYAAEHARELIDAALHLQEIPDHPATELGVFQTVGTVKVPPDVSFDFAGGDVDLQLLEDIDQFNFRELPAGTVLARVPKGRGGWLSVEDNDGREVSERYLILEDGEIHLRHSIMPSMLTCNLRVIRQDCLCYFMERLKLP